MQPILNAEIVAVQTIDTSRVQQMYITNVLGISFETYRTMYLYAEEMS